MKLFLSLLLATALVTVAALIVMQPGETGDLRCLGDKLAITQDTVTHAVYSCLAYTPTPVPTPIAPYAAAPLCPTHDPAAFHTLWDDKRGCYYNHSHGTDPKSINDIFGPLPWGYEISYPWETFVGADSTYKPKPADPALWERNLKHEGYHWLVDRDVPCNLTFVPNQTTCIRAFRAVVHILPHRYDATIRYHSFWVESLVCWGTNFATCGIVRNGGWIDFGKLMIDDVHYPLPNDAVPLPAGGPERLHRWNGGPYNNNVNRDSTWYGANGQMSLAVNFETLSALEPDAALTEHFFCPAYGVMGGDVAATCVGKAGIPAYAARQNGSLYTQHIIDYNFRDNLDGVVDGKVNIHGYTDRFGNVVTGCTAIGLDCVPFEVQSVPVGEVQFNGVEGQVEMDAPAVAAGKYWLRYTVH